MYRAAKSGMLQEKEKEQIIHVLISVGILITARIVSIIKTNSLSGLFFSDNFQIFLYFSTIIYADNHIAVILKCSHDMNVFINNEN
jgi:hypothetical protein